MPRFAANLDFLFQEVLMPQRFAAAAAAGFTAVEILFPYGFPAQDLRGWLAAARLRQVLLNLPAGDWRQGERGLAALPGRQADFRDGLATALAYAETLGCRWLHALAGVLPDGVAAPAAERAYRDNLAFAADAAGRQGITIGIEPLNQHDVPGYFLRDTSHARQVIADVGSPHLKLQYDLYHAQIIEGNLTRTFEANLDIIGHVQVAGPPDRHEPNLSEVDFGYLFERIDRLGYRGWIGCEYRPLRGTVEGLGWAKAYGIG